MCVCVKVGGFWNNSGHVVVGMSFVSWRGVGDGGPHVGLGRLLGLPNPFRRFPACEGVPYMSCATEF